MMNDFMGAVNSVYRHLEEGGEEHLDRDLNVLKNLEAAQHNLDEATLSKLQLCLNLATANRAEQLKPTIGAQMSVAAEVKEKKEALERKLRELVKANMNPREPKRTIEKNTESKT